MTRLGTAVLTALLAAPAWADCTAHTRTTELAVTSSVVATCIAIPQGVRQ